MIKIADKRIGEGEKCFIIAEVGSNHDGSLQQAFHLINIAKECGADAVKFQIFYARELYSENSPHYATAKKAEIPRDWVQKLSLYCKDKGIIFLATPFDLLAVDLLETINVPAYKIASYEIDYWPLLNYVARTHKPVILSTGTSNLSDVERALTTFYTSGGRDIVLLHCVSNYPTEYKDLNLRAMETMKQAFQVPIGFSDHSLGITAPIVARSLGACVIEKHFTLDRNLVGADHPFSLEPHELTIMIKAIRATETMLGSPIKKCRKAEGEAHKLRRKYFEKDFSWRRE